MAYGGDRDSDTICAVSTPSGVGGVAIVRVSGPQAFAVTRKLAHFLPTAPETHKIYFGTFRDLKNASPIDEVLISTFHQGKSFTGEETAEISCHGSPAITQWILQELILSGARAADRGEFSYRAFINGRIDLIQAEGILELVESQSRRSAQQGLRQLKGGLSESLKGIQREILYVLANIEAAIDFSTEDISVINKQELLVRIEKSEQKLRALLKTYEQGRLLNEGLRVSLLGSPNVGKSSLFNLLLQESRSIVTHLPGTTRDVVDSSLLLDGIKITISDTAGIRDSADLVEQLGIQRSRESQDSADVVLFVFDANRELSEEEIDLLAKAPPRHLVLIGNKIDQAQISEEGLLRQLSQKLLDRKIFKSGGEIQEKVLFISTLEHKFREIVLGALKGFLVQENWECEAVITQARHFTNLTRAVQCLSQSREALAMDGEIELVALDAKEALICVQETLGERFDDQIMDFVFQQFCIGK